MSEEVYLSTDHETFCVKHRSYSVTYSLCPVCYGEIDSLRRENEICREALQKIKKHQECVVGSIPASMSVTWVLASEALSKLKGAENIG